MLNADGLFLSAFAFAAALAAGLASADCSGMSVAFLLTAALAFGCFVSLADVASAAFFVLSVFEDAGFALFALALFFFRLAFAL
jgi:hypothetical protein